MDFREKIKLADMIKREINFSAYLLEVEGYTLIEKSASTLTFKKDGYNNLVLYHKHTPPLYFIRNETTRRHNFFEYLRNFKEPNFDKAIKLGLELIDRSYEINTLDVVKQSNKKNSSLLSDYIVTKTLENSDYLINERGISSDTINSKIFKNSIVNAYNKRVKIPNIAFKMFDEFGVVKNYRLNNSYYNKKEGVLKKFKCVLDPKNSQYLFTSNKKIDKIETVFLVESEIDALSHFEINQDYNSYYICFGGGLGIAKKTQILKELKSIQINNKFFKIESITDNDISGYKYDSELMCYLFSAAKNRFNLEYKPNKKGYEIIYRNPEIDLDIILKKVFQDIETIKKLVPSKNQVECIRFKDMILFSMSFTGKDHNLKKEELAHRSLIETIAKTIDSFDFKIKKSILKDWNEDLKKIKKKELKLIKKKQNEQHI